MEEKGIALTILAVVAIIAIVGFVLLFTKTSTGKFTYAGGHIQYDPKEACTNIGCTLSNQIVPAGQWSYALCNCPNEPQPRQVSLVQQYYP